MNIADPGIRLSRWRLVLSEFFFEVKYREGSQNRVADAISRLPTYVYITADPELAIPTFLIENSDALVKYRTNTRADSSSRPKSDWNPYENQDEAHLLNFFSCNTTLPVETETEFSAVILNEIREAQENHPECKAIRAELAAKRETPYIEDEHGLIIRVAEVDGIFQLFVPRILRKRLLHPCSSHSVGGTSRDNTSILHNAEAMVLAFNDG